MNRPGGDELLKGHPHTIEKGVASLVVAHLGDKAEEQN